MVMKNRIELKSAAFGPLNDELGIDSAVSPLFVI
jgi:hypothetical protein